MATQEQKIVQALGGGAGSTHLMCPHCGNEGGPDLSQLLRAGPRPRRARATTRRGGETWRQRADSDAETNVGGHQLGYCRRCGALVADTAIHRTLSCHGGREGLLGRGGQGPVADRRGGLEDPQRLTDGEGRRRRGVGRARRAAHDAESAPEGPVRRHAADPQPCRRRPGFVRRAGEGRARSRSQGPSSTQAPTDRTGRWPSSESCRGVGRPVTHLRGDAPRRACGRLALEAWGIPIDKRLSLCCWALCRDAARRTGAQGEARQDDEREPAVGCARTRLARAWLARPRAGTDQEPAGVAADCGVSHACSADRRSLWGDASSLPSRGALIALWIQAVPAAAVLRSLVRSLLTSGVHGHSLPCGLNASDRRTLGGLSGHLRVSLR